LAVATTTPVGRAPEADVEGAALAAELAGLRRLLFPHAAAITATPINAARPAVRHLVIRPTLIIMLALGIHPAESGES
jgi:hypothetical protein